MRPVPACATHPTQQAFERTPCPSCGGARSSFVIAAPDRLTSDDSRRFTVVRCLDCGLAYLSPRPTADEAGRYYPESYSGGDRGGPIGVVRAGTTWSLPLAIELDDVFNDDVAVPVDVLVSL